MNFYSIRLKRHPDRYVGKEGITYQISCDQKIADLIKRQNYKDADGVHGIGRQYTYFKAEKFAKIWTTRSSIQSVLTLCSGYGHLDDPDKATFSEFEVVVVEDGKETIEPLDNFRKPR